MGERSDTENNWKRSWSLAWIGVIVHIAVKARCQFEARVEANLIQRLLGANLRAVFISSQREPARLSEAERD